MRPQRPIIRSCCVDSAITYDPQATTIYLPQGSREYICSRTQPSCFDFQSTSLEILPSGPQQDRHKMLGPSNSTCVGKVISYSELISIWLRRSPPSNLYWRRRTSVLILMGAGWKLVSSCLDRLLDLMVFTYVIIFFVTWFSRVAWDVMIDNKNSPR